MTRDTLQGHIMLIHVGPDRTESIDLMLAGALSSIAGALNAAGFLLASKFTANMTGNISAFADQLVVGETWLALIFLALAVVFILGAGVAAATIQIGLARKLRGIFAWAILVEAALLLGLSIALTLAPQRAAEALIVFSLSFVMGFQNAVTTLISQARVRTTHISGMATDIGIGLAALASGPEGRRDAAPRLKLYSLTLVCFALGGIAGAVLFGLLGQGFFALAAGVLILIGWPETRRARRLGVS
ncbi:YoaK family protein [uncultured Maritimibacter sp.]|uniref:YoaK family protein n=1 Tax=uncultured Maritimibacter sp. TaxID=991866 RepID=UPI002625530E|nr:YoaK family protein [uncultured Maritimibacter sp.]